MTKGCFLKPLNCFVLNVEERAFHGSQKNRLFSWASVSSAKDVHLYSLPTLSIYFDLKKVKRTVFIMNNAGPKKLGD